MDPCTGFAEFVEIAEAGSISEAARRLKLPRATLSRHLADLESRLGVRLFHRGTRRQVLSPAGQELLQRARRIVADAKAATAAVARLDGVPRGLLRISIPPESRSNLFNWLLTEFLEAHPEIQLEVSASTAHVDLVAEGFDLAIRAGPVVDAGLVCRKLAEIRVLAVASPTYLQTHGTPESFTELEQHICIRGFDQGTTPATRWRLPNGQDCRVHGRLASNSLSLQVVGALEGQGIALLPEPAIASYLETGKLHRVLASEVNFTTALHIVYPEREFLEPKVRTLIDHCVARVPQAFERLKNRNWMLNEADEAERDIVRTQQKP